MQASDYQSPDPLAYFFRKAALEVRTFQIADLILPQYKSESYASATGGDAKRKCNSIHQNPFKRSREKAVVSWSGIMDAGREPKTLLFHVPDCFNGRLRVMAVGVGVDTIGSAVEHAEVQADFAIQPHIPLFAAPGDLFFVTADITNCLPDQNVETPLFIELEATPHLKILGNKKREVNLDMCCKSRIAFPVKVNNTLGEGEIKIKVTRGDKTSERKSTIIVRPASPFRTKLTGGFSDAAKKNVLLERQLYAEHRKGGIRVAYVMRKDRLSPFI